MTTIFEAQLFRSYQWAICLEYETCEDEGCRKAKEANLYSLGHECGYPSKGPNYVPGT